MKNLHKSHHKEAAIRLQKLKQAAVQNTNIFDELMEACKVCSIGQISKALFEVGGQYRRNM
jgi:methylmalonyl-CoA mutase